MKKFDRFTKQCLNCACYIMNDDNVECSDVECSLEHDVLAKTSCEDYSNIEKQ